MSETLPISNKKLIFQIILILIISSISAIFISTVYIKKLALHNLGEDDAKKTSTLIFEIMNTKMQEGWKKEDLVSIINNLEHIREGLNISSYRSEKVEELYGVIKEDKKIVQNDTLIQKAMQGEKQFLIQKDGSIRYLYPMIVKQQCITCHNNAQIGDVNGVLEITYPPNEIKISLDMLIKYFLSFFITFTIISFVILYFIISKKIINPIIKFTEHIEEITENTELLRKSDLKPKIKEIYILENSFNKLLMKIKFFYTKVIEGLYTDSLTSLSNNTKLKEDLKHNDINTLMIINIDSFTEINNFYGVKAGDEILIQVSKYLKKEVKHIGKPYRLYGDEFAILTHKNIGKDDCINLLDTLNKKSFSYLDTPIEVQLSMGVAYNEEERIIEKAIIALRTAKNKKSIYEEYDNSLELQEKYSNHITWRLNIKEALLNDNILIFFQPIKNLKNNSIDKYECLVRLDLNNKIHLPFEFLEISKKAKLYPMITKRVIEKSFKYFNERPNYSFSINISMDDILNNSTVSFLFEMLQKYNIGSQLIVELLESEELNDFDIVKEFVDKIKKYEVKIAIDDFGSGYSNFTYLINLNVDFIKIDSSLVKDLDTNNDSRTIVESIVNFAKHKNIKTVAEMVHKKEIEDILKEIEVDYVQGFYIGKPEKNIL